MHTAPRGKAQSKHTASNSTSTNPASNRLYWGVHPLSVLCRIEPEPLYEQLRMRMLSFIERMIAAQLTPLALGKDLPRGTWQHVYIVEQMFQVAAGRQ